MATTRSAKLFGAAAIALAGTFIGLRGLGLFNRSVTASPGPIPDIAAAHALDSIREFVESTSPEQCVLTAEKVRVHVSANLPAEIATRDAMSKAIEKAIAERTKIMLDPSYDAYASYVGKVIGRDGRTALQGTMFGDINFWNAFAGTFRFAAVAPEAVLVRYGRTAADLPDLQGGRQVTLGDPGFYGSESLINQGSPLVEVAIPMMLAPNDDRPNLLVVFVTTRFVWNEARAQWIPVSTGVHDPTGINQDLPPLWI